MLCTRHKKSEIQISQSFKLTERFGLSHITGQAVPENCSAITEAVLHEVIVIVIVKVIVIISPLGSSAFHIV